MIADYPESTLDTKATKGIAAWDMDAISAFVDFVTRRKYTLDQLEVLTNAAFPVGFFVYRGGSHVALHAVHGDARILMLSIKDGAPSPLPRTKRYASW